MIQLTEKSQSKLLDVITLIVFAALYFGGVLSFERDHVLTNFVIVLLVLFRMVFNIRNYIKTKSQVYLGWSVFYGFLMMFFLYFTFIIMLI